MTAQSPLDLRALFAQPWEGEGRLWRPWWLRLLPVPGSFRFRSEIADVSDAGWEVIDRTTWPDGRVETRRMRCAPAAGGRLRLAAPDMPRGAEVVPRADGFDFAPFVLRTPVFGRLRLRLHCTDTVDVHADGTMVDRLTLRWLGVRVGDVVITLRQVPFEGQAEQPRGPLAALEESPDTEGRGGR